MCYIDRQKNKYSEEMEFKSLQSKEFSLLNIIQTGSGVHPTSYPMGTLVSLPRDKVAGV
jgi:hypothetical protein